jgi:hypothetical protein
MLAEVEGVAVLQDELSSLSPMIQVQQMGTPLKLKEKQKLRRLVGRCPQAEIRSPAPAQLLPPTEGVGVDLRGLTSP